jgi:hypothetical protein
VDAAFEDLEDEGGGFLAEFAVEDLEALESRGFQRVEPVALEHLADGGERGCAAADLVGEEAAGA